MSSKNRWVIYPDIDITIDDYKTYLKMDESIKENAAAEELLDTETIIHEGELNELTEEEKREEFIKQLKESKIKNAFRPIKQDGNITTNQFGANYKKKRRVKNKSQKKSRKLSRG